MIQGQCTQLLQDKMKQDTEWTNVSKHRGKAFLIIQGQFTQLLQEKMKQDMEWTNVSTSYDPLALYRLIEITVLAQNEDH
jgi:hypothetical protein